MKKNKIVLAEEAIATIKDGDVVCSGGFVGIGTPEELLIALADRYKNTSSPKGLTLLFSSGLGDGDSRGLNRLALRGLWKRVIAGHYGLMPKMGKLALENEFEAYNLPQGILTNLYRAIAANRPGVFSKVGLGTFADPRVEGGKVNEKAKEDIVEVMSLGGEEWLWVKPFPINVAFIRGTTADIEGNITMEKEVLTLDTLAMATAVKNSGGIVIAQVGSIADARTLKPKLVKVPGILVDYIVLAKPENHLQTYVTPYSPVYSGEVRVPLRSVKKLEMTGRKVIARRAAMELKPYDVINLGIGVPEGISSIANEERILDYLTMTVEPGIIGGMPTGGLEFGGAVNYQSVIDMPDQFDFYDGGGLDMAVLGMAQADQNGNVNVSRFGPKLAGCGGFVNISQNAKKVCFLGTFTSGGLEVAIEDGKLRILKEGKVKKFVKQVQQITFSGKVGGESGREIFYMSERCIFKLRGDQIELMEVAPGIDIEKDILGQMDFRPIMDNVKEMDLRIFKDGSMGIRHEFLNKDLQERMEYIPAENIMKLNFQGLEIETRDDIEKIRQMVESKCRTVGKKVKAVINYDSFNISDDLMDHYIEMAKYINSNYCEDTVRHTSSDEMRERIVEHFAKHAINPSMFATREEAEKELISI